MFTNKRSVRIEWGDCDPAGIVFYPRYFAIFDACTTVLFERALGMTKHQFLKNYDFLGYPLVDSRARFLSPNSFGDEVVVESAISEIKRSSFNIRHRITKGDVLAVEGLETRVWVVQDPNDPEKMKSKPIPQDVVQRLLGTV